MSYVKHIWNIDEILLYWTLFSLKGIYDNIIKRLEIKLLCI